MLEVLEWRYTTLPQSQWVRSGQLTYEVRRSDVFGRFHLLQEHQLYSPSDLDGFFP